MQQRNQSLDALRGFSILAMVLSSSIAFGILPAWMYHAQVPPPYHAYKPEIPGISWVDLVFPFFLFSMGAAVPLALNKKIQSGEGFTSIFFLAARRFLLLVFFALFTFHMRAWVLSGKPQLFDYALSVGAFVLLFFQFYQPQEERAKKIFGVVRLLAFAIAAALLYILPSKDGKGFSFYKIDIIILVLGNMAFFGTLIWWFTRNIPWLRIGILPLVMAIFLGSKEAGSWNDIVYNWSPLPWMYKFYYLKYLFIIIPGTIAGDLFLKYNKTPVAPERNTLNALRLIGGISLLIVLLNVILLFGRHTVINLFVSVALCIAVHFLLKKIRKDEYPLMHKFFLIGTYVLILGLFFDAYEGGVKKDPSTYSYYFITSGLAFFMLSGFYGLQLSKAGSGIVNYLAQNGRNPMVAYVTGNLLLIPVLHLTGLITPFKAMGSNVWTGFLQGLLFTGVVSLITVFFVRRKWFWKT